MKKLIPKIAKISKAKPLINVTFPSSGIARKSALTTSFKLSFLEIILRGLRPRKARIDLKLLSADELFSPIVRFVTLVNTTIKSSTFHPTFRYAGLVFGFKKTNLFFSSFIF